MSVLGDLSAAVAASVEDKGGKAPAGLQVGPGFCGWLRPGSARGPLEAKGLFLPQFL